MGLKLAEMKEYRRQFDYADSSLASFKEEPGSPQTP